MDGSGGIMGKQSKQSKQLTKEAYAELVKKYDARDKLYELLEKHFVKYGYTLPKYLPDWNKYQQDKRKWRDIPGLNKRLWKIAKKMAKNVGLKPGQKLKMSQDYLDKQLKKMNNREK
jgi:hypothetical protein